MYNLHHVAYDLVYSLGTYSKNIETRQQVVKILLDKINYLFVHANYVTQFKREDYTVDARERLKEIVFKGKNTDELEMLRKYYRLERSSMKSLVLDIDKTSKAIVKNHKTAGNLQFVKDSIFNYYVDYDVNYYKKEFRNERVIRLIGWLGMKECIPQLENMLISNPYFPSKELTLSIKYTLARLGVTKYEDEILSSEENIRYTYLHTEKALYRFLELEYDTVKLRCRVMPCAVKCSWAYFAIREVEEYILNYPKELLINQFESKKTDEQMARQGYKWIMENKGKLVLSDDFW